MTERETLAGGKTERDPKLHPRKGDELSKDGKTRQIDGIGDYIHWVRNMSEYGSCNLTSWRKWAATATIIKRGEDAQ